MKGIKFTESEDGVMRATIHIRIRLDEDQLKAIEAYAKYYGFSVHSAIRGEAELAVEGLIDRASEVVDSTEERK